MQRLHSERINEMRIAKYFVHEKILWKLFKNNSNYMTLCICFRWKIYLYRLKWLYTQETHFLIIQNGFVYLNDYVG